MNTSADDVFMMMTLINARIDPLRCDDADRSRIQRFAGERLRSFFESSGGRWTIKHAQAHVDNSRDKRTAFKSNLY